MTMTIDEIVKRLEIAAYNLEAEAFDRSGVDAALAILRPLAGPKPEKVIVDSVPGHKIAWIPNGKSYMLVEVGIAYESTLIDSQDKKND